MRFSENIGKIWVLGLVTLVMIVGTSSAQEEIFFLGEELGVGARATTMGGAYVGVADDYSAIYWNPAGLGQLRRMELNLGFSHSMIDNDATFLGNTFKGETSFTRLNSIGFVMPVPTYQGSLVFGIGYNKVRDFDNVLDIEGFNTDHAAFADIVAPTYPDYTTDILGNLNQAESIFEEGSLNHFSLSGAVEIQERFYVGATINFVGGTDDYNVIFSEEDIENLYNVPPTDENPVISDLDYWDYDQLISSKFNATNLKIGALYKFNSALRIGATIITPTTYKITETWNENFTETYDGGIVVDEPEYQSDSGEFEYKIKEPYGIDFGASFRFLNFLVSGSMEFKDWAQAKFTTEPPIAGVDKADVNINIKQNLQSVTKVRLGAEMYLPILGARVRAGYFNNPSPYRYTNDALPDKEYLTAGASIMLDKQVMLDVGLLHGSWEQETSDGLTQAITLEDKTYNKIIGTLSIRF